MASASANCITPGNRDCVHIGGQTARWPNRQSPRRESRKRSNRASARRSWIVLLTCGVCLPAGFPRQPRDILAEIEVAASDSKPHEQHLPVPLFVCFVSFVVKYHLFCLVLEA